MSGYWIRIQWTSDHISADSCSNCHLKQFRVKSRSHIRREENCRNLGKNIMLVFINKEILWYHILGNESLISCDSRTSRHSFFCTLRGLIGLVIIFLQEETPTSLWFCAYRYVSDDRFQKSQSAEADKETKM